MTGAAFTRPRRLARAIIEELGISSPDHIQIEKIAVDRGLYHREVALQGCDARLVTSEKGDSAVASINSQIPEEGRKRFALAHELGHFELHRAKSPRLQCDESDFLKLYRESSLEPEANAFAAEILMPEPIFQKNCEGNIPSYDLLCSLADTFRTSLTSTAFRYVEIGNHPCALIAVRSGKIERFTASNDFRHRLISPGTAVRDFTGAGEFFKTGNPVSSTSERIPAYSWLEDFSSSDTLELYEASIVMPRYQTVITLIWEP